MQAAGLARYYEHDAKEDWRAATALVLGKAGPFLCHPVLSAVRAPTVRLLSHRLGRAFRRSARRLSVVRLLAFVPRSGPEPTLDSALALASRHRRIWVVLSHDDQDSSTVEAIARGALSANRDTVAEWRLRGIRVREYEGRALVPDERHE